MSTRDDLLAPIQLTDTCGTAAAGSYELTVTNELRSTNEVNKTKIHWTNRAHVTFNVAAPRVRLAAGDVAAVYPPVGSCADYSACLPHVVFARRGLPWERRLENDESKPRRPWVALLVLSSQDLATAVVQEVPLAKLRDETNLPASRWGDAQPSEEFTGETTITVLDIDAKDYHRLAPMDDEATLLAHGRGGISAAGKAEGVGQDTYGVIVANRRPVKGRNMAVLVSLECAPTAKAGRARLVVLHRWDFESRAGEGTFKAMIERIHASPLAGITSSTSGALTQKIATGAVPIALDRDASGRTLAWYRGPLAPEIVEPFADNAARFVRPDHGRVDDAGLVDVSYAAAWELGRLLALGSGSFASSLRAWAGLRAGEALREREMIEERRGTLEGWTPRQPSFVDDLVECMELGDERTSGALEHARAAGEWLADLVLLKSLPFRYLVPSSRLVRREICLFHGVQLECRSCTGLRKEELEKLECQRHKVTDCPACALHYRDETLRVFHVDPRWIDALSDGALSIASWTARPERTPRGGIRLRRALRHLRACRVDPPKDTKPKWKADAPVPLVSGFLLRSRVLDAFPGIEIQVLDRTGILPFIRLDRPAAGILLGMVEGRPTQIRLLEPREGLRFGVEPDSTVKLAADDGTQQKTAAVPLEPRGDVVDVRALAKSLGSTERVIGAARLALHLLRRPDDAKFEWNEKTDP